MNDSRKTVLTSIRSFVDLWGPARIIYSDPERSIVSKIQTERGTIGRRTSKSKVGGAVDCHWFSWDEFIPPDIEPFEEGSRLAIGAHLGHEMHFDVRSRSTCSTPKETTGAILKNTSSSEELGLIPDSWVLDAINFTLGISKGFVGNLGGVDKRIPGRSRKGLLLLEWASENPDPLTLKARIGLEISGCTGNALRLPLWELLRLDSVKDYVRRVLPNYLPKTFTGVPSFLDAFDRGFDNFMRLWVQNDEFRKSTVIIVRKLLQSLAFTGLKKGDLSAWFIDKPGGLLIRNCNQHNWLKLLADSDGEACLAVISRRCLQCACSDVVKCGATSMELHTALWTKINLEVQNDQQIDLHSRNHELQRRKVCYGSELPAHSDDDFQQSAFLSAALSKILLRHKPTDASSLIGLSTDPTAIPSSPITDRGDTPITNPAASVMSPNVGDATTLDEDAGSSSTIMATVYDLRGHKRIIMPRLCNESTNKVPAVKLEKSMLGWLTPFLAKGLGANSYSYREVTELETVDSQSIQVCFR
jgi:hypothetical protein